MDNNQSKRLYSLIIPTVISLGITNFNKLLFNNLANIISDENVGFTEDDFKRTVIITSASVTFKNLIDYIIFKTNK